MNADYQIHVYITHSNSELEEALALFHMAPTRHVRKGSDRFTVSGLPLNRTAKLSVVEWRMHEQVVVASENDNLTAELTKVCTLLSAQKGIIRRLIEQGARLALEVALRPRETYAAFCLDRELIRRLDDLKMEIEVCVVARPGLLKGEH